MSESVQFDDLDQLKALLRAGMEYKFHVSDDSDLLNGSPFYALALSNVREALISGLRANASIGQAQVHVDWYQLERHPRIWSVISRRASLHPDWQDLDVVEVRRWIEVLASPLTVNDETLEAIRREVEETLRGE